MRKEGICKRQKEEKRKSISLNGIEGKEMKRIKEMNE